MSKRALVTPADKPTLTGELLRRVVIVRHNVRDQEAAEELRHGEVHQARAHVRQEAVLRRNQQPVQRQRHLLEGGTLAVDLSHTCLGAL